MGLCLSEGEDDMSRGKSGALRAAVRPKSDAGHAGWRPRVDMAAPDLEADIEAGRVLDFGAVVRMRAAERAAESARQRPPNPIEYPPIEPILAAIVAPIEAEAREIAAPVEPHDPRRMTQPGLFDALGVKV